MNTYITDNNDLKFKDISDELWRQYDFPGGSYIRINEPLSLNVSASGGHRIASKDGIAHYIPFKWVHLSWKVKEGHPQFRF